MFNPYLTYPQQNPQQQYNDLLQRLQHLEGRTYGNQNVSQSNPESVSQPTIPVTQTNNANNFISVTSESEAWEYIPDLSGKKQYFIDEVNNAFYVKWFSASEPKTYKAIYKPIESIIDKQVDELVKNDTSDFKGVLVDISEGIEGLGGKIDALNENIDQTYGKIDDLILQIRETPYILMKDVVTPKKSKSESNKK